MGARLQSLSQLLRRRWPWVLTAGAAGAAALGLLAANLAAPGCGTSAADIGCGTPTLAPRPGFSVVTASGHLTGRTRIVQGTVDHQMRLDHVVVLGGGARPATVSGWLATVPHPGAGLAAAQVPGLWAPDGRLLAQLPPHPERAGEASTIQIRPIVHGRVVFSAAACSAAPEGLRTAAFTGPLAEVPGSRAYAVARCTGDVTASPLDQVERLLR